jgi:hypothetical protein
MSAISGTAGDASMPGTVGIAMLGLCDDDVDLHWACYDAEEHEVELLLEEGADVNAVNEDDGGTALMRAAESGSLGCAALCLRFGADLRHADRGGHTALHYAWTGGPGPDHAAVADLLAAAGGRGCARNCDRCRLKQKLLSRRAGPTGRRPAAVAMPMPQADAESVSPPLSPTAVAEPTGVGKKKRRKRRRKKTAAAVGDDAVGDEAVGDDAAANATDDAAAAVDGSVTDWSNSEPGPGWPRGWTECTETVWREEFEGSKGDLAALISAFKAEDGAREFKAGQREGRAGRGGVHGREALGMRGRLLAAAG